MESGAVDILVGLTKRDNPQLRLNGIWALMVRNGDFPSREQSLEFLDPVSSVAEYGVSIGSEHQDKDSGGSGA